MPFRQHLRYRARPRRYNRAAGRIQRSWRRRRRKPLAKRVTTLAKKVKAITNKNWIDISLAPFSVTSAAQYHSLALDQIATGTADNQRIGREITVNSWSIRGAIYNSADDQFDNIRLLVILIPEFDSQATSQFLQDPTTYLSHYKKNGDCLFTVLYDRTVTTNNHTVTANTGQATRPQMMNFVINSYQLKKFKPFKSRYRANTATQPDRNNLVLMYISDSGFATHPTVEYKMRLNYNP